MRVLFFGTSGISKEILESLLSAGFEIPAVITTPDRKVGRGGAVTENPVAALAKERGITLYKGEKPGDFAAELSALKSDFFVVADYGKIIPKEILEIPSRAPVNVHYSLLPKYRGASPMQSALINGDKETGVTIMLMNEKLDEGDILAQEKVAIDSEDDRLSLTKKLNAVGKKLLTNTLREFAEGKIKPVPQDSGNASYTKRLTKEDGRIDWTKDAFSIERKVRAFKKWPGAWTELDGKKVKLIEAEGVNNNIIQPELGRICNVGGNLHVECGPSTTLRTGGTSLLINRLQIEGKKETSGGDFLNTLREREARFV